MPFKWDGITHYFHKLISSKYQLLRMEITTALKYFSSSVGCEYHSDGKEMYTRLLAVVAYLQECKDQLLQFFVLLGRMVKPFMVT